MALVRTAKLNVTSGDAFGAGAYSPTAYTPADNSLQVAVIQSQQQSDDGITGAALTLSSSPSLTWTKQASTAAAPAGWSQAIAIFTAPVTTGASTTVTVDAGAFSTENYRVDIYEFTSDSSGTLGVGASGVGSDADGNGAASLTLSAAPASSSHIIAAANVSRGAGPGGSVTEGSGWTELIDVARNDWWTFQAQARTAYTGTSVDWADLEGSGAATGINAVLAAVEITETASAGPTITAHPADQTVNNSATATFTVSATGTGTLNYQWKDDGANVGTNSATYDPTATYADQGAQITAVVTDDNGSATSNAATLRVAFNLSGTGPRTFPLFGGGPFGAGAFGEFMLGSVTGGGGPVTVALTGQAFAYSQGAVSPSVAAPLIGAAGTYAQGAVSGAVSKALAGVSSAYAQGSLSPALAAGLVGQVAAYAQGTLTPVLSAALAGVSQTYSQGVIAAAVSAALGGQSVAYAQGTLTANVAGDVTVALTGQAITYAQGLLSPALVAAISGQATAWQQGSVSPGASVGLGGASVGYAAGQLRPGASVGLSGEQVAYSQGAVTASVAGDVVVALTGLQIGYQQGVLGVNNASIPVETGGHDIEDDVLQRLQEDDAEVFEILSALFALEVFT